jgi:hypothetical protein
VTSCVHAHNTPGPAGSTQEAVQTCSDSSALLAAGNPQSTMSAVLHFKPMLLWCCKAWHSRRHQGMSTHCQSGTCTCICILPALDVTRLLLHSCFPCSLFEAVVQVGHQWQEEHVRQTPQDHCSTNTAQSFVLLLGCSTSFTVIRPPVGEAVEARNLGDLTAAPNLLAASSACSTAQTQVPHHKQLLCCCIASDATAAHR